MIKKNKCETHDCSGGWFLENMDIAVFHVCVSKMVSENDSTSSTIDTFVIGLYIESLNITPPAKGKVNKQAF